MRRTCVLVGALFIGASGLPSAAHAQQIADVVLFSDGSTVAGKARLDRHATGMTMSIDTTQLTPGYVYTIWWLIFNEPENCTASNDFGGLCGSADFGNAAVMAAGLYGDGVIAFANGQGHIASHRLEGFNGVSLFGPGVVNPLTAEVHLVVRCHGAKVAGLVASQLTTLNGGCTNATGGSNGLPGPNTCTDVQFVVFPPPA